MYFLLHTVVLTDSLQHAFNGTAVLFGSEKRSIAACLGSSPNCFDKNNNCLSASQLP